jgi:transcriptional regulator with XRE-family HTH domain
MPKDSELLNRLGTEIRRRRKVLHWSQEKLAQEANLSLKHISEIETGLRNLGVATLEKITTALKTSPAELLEFTRSVNHKPDPALVFEELLEMLKGRPGLQAEFAARLVEELRKSIGTS